MKENRGITLIALVVTVVVLLILAVISVNIAFRNEGIFGTAKDSADKTAEQSDYEANILPEEMKQFIDEAVNQVVGNTECQTTYCNGSVETTIACTATGCSAGSLSETCGKEVLYKISKSYGSVSSKCPCGNSLSATGTELYQLQATCSSHSNSAYVPVKTYYCSNDCLINANGNIAGTVFTYCSKTVSSPCTICEGDGEVLATANCEHGYSSPHYYCTLHGHIGDSSSH